MRSREMISQILIYNFSLSYNKFSDGVFVLFGKLLDHMETEEWEVKPQFNC